jgi:hypothetical protein
VHKVRVPAGKRIKVKRLRYEASAQHCSSGRILIKLTGANVGKTDWVDAGEDTTVELLDLTLRHRKGGKAHRFTYRFQGKIGGCNTGLVGSWLGGIKLSGSKRST